MQASTTQTDIIVSFFILTSVYFAIKSVNEIKLQNYFFLGLSTGLSCLTKATAYIYLAPILLIFAVLVIVYLFKIRNYTVIKYSIVAALIFISINSGHYIRNYNLTNNILGVDKNESKMYSNEKMTPKLLVSNIIKNAGLHLGPYPINEITEKAIYKLHYMMGVNINNDETNFQGLSYIDIGKIPNNEDNAPNTIHFFIILLSFILIGYNIFKNKKGLGNMMLYIGMIILQVIFFCAYLKWQPWHTRLHTPLFMISVPLVSYAISLNTNYIKVLYKFVPLIIICTLFVILFNNLSPFISNNRITSKISITDNRYKKYFARRSNLYKEYNETVENISNLNYKNIGLILGGYDWEYPLFSQFYGRDINPIHINVKNITKDIPINTDNLDCIISTKVNDTVIDFKGKRYHNHNCKNKVIWLFCKYQTPKQIKNRYYTYHPER